MTVSRHGTPMQELAALLRPSQSQPLSAVWAHVTDTDSTTNSLTLQLGGSTAPVAGVGYLSSYIPNPGDTVLALRIGTDLFVLGPRG